MPTTYAIPNGRTVMDATTWTGTNSTGALTVSNLQFKPDLVWSKSRSNAFNNQLTDSVRGINKTLISNSTAIQDPTNVSGAISSFNSNGFTATPGSSDNWYWNYNGGTFVGWAWQAGQGTTATNTNGSVNSTVSVNTAAGFSVVQYVVPSSGTSFTWGHGLPATPQFIIIKGGITTNTYNWDVYCASLGPTVRLVLNSTSATQTYSGPWNDTNPTSTVVSQQNGWYASGDTNIAYCWTPIAGFSQFGSYTGNGSSDGPFVYTGFKPRFLMYKRTDSAGGWFMVDSTRNPVNTANYWLNAAASDAEQTDDAIDLNSNGFKIRTTGTGTNASGGSYTYMVWAENPFKYANAR